MKKPIFFLANKEKTWGKLVDIRSFVNGHLKQSLLDYKANVYTEKIYSRPQGPSIKSF